MAAVLALVAREPSDTELVQHARQGDARALESLMRRHNRTLFRTARAILNDDAEAEDAVQEAYIQAFRALDGFRAESKFSTWIVRIVANQALMRRRRRVREAQVLPIDRENGEALMEGTADPAPGPEGEAMNAQMRRLLERRIADLPDLYREAFVLRAVEEMSVEETAEALGVPEATVRTRFFRARALLRAAFEQDIDFALGETFAFAGARCDRIVANVLARLAVPPPASG